MHAMQRIIMFGSFVWGTTHKHDERDLPNP